MISIKAAKRQCVVKTCECEISPQAGPQVTMCGTHQARLRELCERFPEVMRRLEHFGFVKLRLDGCSANALARHIGESPRTVIRQITEFGRIGAEMKRPKGQRRDCWWIPTLEMVRVIDLLENWVPSSKVLAAYPDEKICLELYLADAKRGVYGKTRRPFKRGTIAIHKSEVPNVPERYRRERRRNLANRNLARLSDSQLDTEEMAGLLGGVRRSAVVYWIKKGEIVCDKDVRFWKTTYERFYVFCWKVVQVRFRTRHDFRARAKAAMAEVAGHVLAALVAACETQDEAAITAICEVPS